MSNAARLFPMTKTHVENRKHCFGNRKLNLFGIIFQGFRPSVWSTTVCGEKTSLLEGVRCVAVVAELHT